MPDTIIYYTEDGGNISLNDITNYIVTASKGEKMPAVSHLVDEVPGLRGVNFKRAKIGQRDVELKITVRGATLSALSTNIRALGTKLEPVIEATTQASYLSWLRDGESVARKLYCRYYGGLPQMSSDMIPEGSIIFRAADPYWYGADVTQAWNVIASGGAFFPFFPLQVSHAAVFQTFTITNAGDVESWPVWTVEGPGSDLAFYNTTTNKKLMTTGSINTGEILTIDTRPGAKYIADANGNRRNNMIVAGSSMWSLRKGANNIRVELSGADANSEVTLTYAPRYNAP
jgi:phage-related protein